MVIFLDIDGVMVPAKSWQPFELMEDDFASFSTQSVMALKSILRDEDAVILTTSHKASYTAEEWKEIFLRRGLAIKNLKILSNDAGFLNRREELLQWFKLNEEPSSFVIIDDDSSLSDLPTPIKQRWVKTQPMIGLTSSHIGQIEDIRSQTTLYS